MGYYNWRGTGRPHCLPVHRQRKDLHDHADVRLAEDAPRAPLRQPAIRRLLQRLHAASLVGGRRNQRLERHAQGGIHCSLVSCFFFLWPQLSLTLLALWRLLRDRRVRLLLIQAALVFSSFLLARAWFNLHYAGPLVATILALLTQALRHIRRWEAWGRPVGIGITRVVVVFVVLLAPFNQRSQDQVRL